jgi:TRAP-type transport system periplasmic protein
MIRKTRFTITAGGLAGMSIAACALVTAFGFTALKSDRANAADKFEFRLADDSNAGETLSDVAQWFADQVTKRSNGRVTITHFTSSTLGTGSALIQGVKNGSIDMINLGASFYVQLYKPLGVLGVPFLFENDGAAKKAAESATASKLLAGLGDKGLNGLALGSNGWIDIITHDKAVKQLSDLKGMRIRALPSQIDIKTLTAFGAVPVHLESKQLYLALRQGTVDGVEATLHLAAKAKLAEVAKYVTLTRQSWLPMIMSMNMAQYKKLPPDLQALVSKTATEAMAMSWAEEQREEVKYDKALKDEGMTVIKLAPKAAAEFHAAAKAVYPGFASIVGADNLKAMQGM